MFRWPRGVKGKLDIFIWSIYCFKKIDTFVPKDLQTTVQNLGDSKVDFDKFPKEIILMTPKAQTK